MALFDNGFRLGTGVAIGLGAIVLVPVLSPVIASVARPLIKAGIKGGLLLFEKTREAIAEAAETMEDIVVEARAELAAELNPPDSVAYTVAEGARGDAS